MSTILIATPLDVIELCILPSVNHIFFLCATPCCHYRNPIALSKYWMHHAVFLWSSFLNGRDVKSLPRLNR